MNLRNFIKKRKKLALGSITAILIASFIPSAYFKYAATAVHSSDNANNTAIVDSTNLFAEGIDYNTPDIKYGFVLNDYRVEAGLFKKNEFLSDILTKQHVPYTTIDKVVKKSTDIYDVRKMRVGQEYLILGPKNKTQPAQYIIYEPSPFRYIVYDLQGETNVTVTERKVDTLAHQSSGVIYSSLWNALIDNDLDYEVAVKMEDALEYHVDFNYLKENDKFKLVYDKLYINGEAVGTGQLKAAYFEQNGKAYYAYYYNADGHEGFFDESGRPMKKAFLQSPVKYTRISSPFNLRRFHPVLKRVKAHLGTDYAAPYGTPIYAVANGTVTRSGFTKGNGNFVKIKHDKTYETQYLHMQKIASTARTGMRVKQGDVIGYVGSTGLATGPHVCFRFWKNGQQVDHRKENLPPPDPMSAEDLKKFQAYIAESKQKLEAMTYKSEEELAKEKVAKKDQQESVTP